MRSSNKRLTDFIFASDLLKNMREVVIENGIEFEHKKHIDKDEPGEREQDVTLT